MPNEQTNGQTRARAEKLEILDSQAEDFEDEDEDLLLDDYLPDTAGDKNNSNTNDTNIPPPHTTTSPPAQQHSKPKSQPQPHPPKTLLILPSLPRLLSPLMHSNHIRGHALLTHLLRSLRHLTASHALCILTLNSVAGVPNPSSNIYTNKQNVDDGVSVFGENAGMRPALGKTFAWGGDLGLMASWVGAAGAKRVVVEVVGDRAGGRVGRWAVVE